MNKVNGHLTIDARIKADLVAKAAADVRRDDADLVLGDSGDQRRNGANGMWRLESPPHRAEPRYRDAGRVHPDLAGIEHAKAENVAILDRASADDLGKEADADAHQLARFTAAEGVAIAPLLVAKRRVTDRVQGLVERSQIVAAVVFPTEGRLVAELLLADQIAAPYFGRVEIELARQHVDQWS